MEVEIVKQGCFCVKALFIATLGIACKHSLPSLKRNVTLALAILIYSSVNCGCSGIASLKSALVIQFL